MKAASSKSQRSGKLAGDLWGGLASALVALPSAIAYGVASYSMLGADFVSQGVIAGILGAAAIGLVAPAFGGAPRLISAPCAPAAAVLAALVAALMADTQSGGGKFNPATIPIFLTIVALLSAGLQLLYGTIRGGQLIKFIPYPVVSGYLSGVGVLIFLSQVPKFFGLPKELHVWEGLASPAHWKWQGMVVGVATIVGVLSGPKITKQMPAPIIGLVSGILVYFGLGMACPEMLKLEHNQLIIGPIGATFSSVASSFLDRWKAIGAVHFQDFKVLLFPAFTLSVLLSIDTLKTCVVVDTLTRSRHNSNRELIGQGLGNLASAVIGGMPGAGTMGATLVNVSSGGRTRLSGVFEGAFALAAFLLFGSLIAWVPIAALAGILIVVAFRMVDWGSLHLLRSRATVLDFLVVAAVVVVAVEVDLIAASGTGLALAVLLFVREQIHGSVIRRKLYGNQLSSKRNRLPPEVEALKQNGHLTVICELQGTLFFGTTDRLFTQIEPDLQQCRFLIFDMKRVLSVDFTAAHMLEQIQTILRERGAVLIFSNLPSSLPSGKNLRAYFDELGVMKFSENVKLFDMLEEAVEWTEGQILDESRMFRHPADCRPLELSEFELFQGTDTTLPLLTAGVDKKTIPAGQPIFRRDDQGDEIFLIRRGLVRVQLPLEDGKHHTLAYFGPGNFFGEMSFLDRAARSADALATTDTDLFILSRKRFDEISKHEPSLGGNVFARLARVLALRLRFTNAELRALEETLVIFGG